MLRNYFRFLIIGLLLFSSLTLNAQDVKDIDSFKQLLSKTKQDTAQINLLNQIAFRYSATDSANAFLYANQALDKAKKLNFKSGIAKALEAKGNYFLYKTNPINALGFFNDAATIWQQLKDEKKYASTLRNIGQAYGMMTKYTEAITSLQKAEDIFVKYKNDVGLNATYHSMALVYSDDGQKEQAISYYLKSLKIQEAINDVKDIGSTQNNLGRLHYETKNYPEAIKYFNQSINSSLKNGDIRTVGITQLNIANIYIVQNDYTSAIGLLEKALNNFQKSNFKRGVLACYNNLGAINIRAGNYDTAIIYLKKGLAIAKENQSQVGVALAEQNVAYTYTLKKEYDNALIWFKQAEQTAQKSGADQYTYGEIYNHRATLDSATGNFESALKYRTKYQEITDKTSNERVTRQVTEMQTKYETEKKDFKINLLNKTDSIKSLQITNQQLVINTNLYQISKQKLALADADLALVNDSFLLATKNGIILKNKLDSTQKEERIGNLNKQSQIQNLELNNQKLEVSHKNSIITVIVILAVMGLLLGYSFYRRYKLQQQAKLQQEILHQQDIATKAIIAAEETERKRIATDLHDGVGQLMSAAKMNLSAIESDLNFTSITQKNAYDKVMALVDEGCKEVRAVSHNMMPNALLRAGLASAVREFLDNLNSKVIKINLYTNGLNKRIDSNTETILYRVIQECVNNVIKHAKASLLDISIVKEDDNISITIEDNGVGFDKNTLKNGTGIGLKNIETRMAFLKGSVDWESQLGKGTLVMLHVNC